MASNKIEDAHPVLRAAYAAAKLEYMAKYPDSPEPIITQSSRPNSEQARLYAQGRTTKGPIVTNAKPGTSPHNFTLSFAIDVGFKKKDGNLDWSDKWFKLFAPYMKKHTGVDWGGDFHSILDMPHYEVHNWRVLSKQK